MRLLLTGANGIIGSHATALAAQDQRWQLVVSRRSWPANLPGRPRFVPADISNADEAAALVRTVKPTHNIHAAWETAPAWKLRRV